VAALVLAGCSGASVHASSTPSTGGAAAAPTTAASSASSPQVSPSAPATTAPALMTTVVSDCGTGAYRPTTIVVTCGNGSVVATQIAWTAWSAASATADAVMQVDPCRPTCASGGDRPYPAHIKLSDPVATSAGPRFSRLTVAWTGASPTNTPLQSYPLPTATAP